jgi:cyclopropane fatty-acyl-phospholipid synthase-like methyltransferase
MYIVYDVKAYFEKITSLEGKKILDFGCNRANFLLNGITSDYTGLDVDLEVINQNKNMYPQHKWIHYENHNNQYNITNKKYSWPVKLETYDIICAFSVFTHTSFVEYSNTISKLKNHLNPGGKILSTYISNTDRDSLTKLYNYRLELFNFDTDSLTDQIINSNTFSLAIDFKTHKLKTFSNQMNIPEFETPQYFITFYNDTWLQKQLTGNIVDVTKNFNDIRGGQRCIVI